MTDWALDKPHGFYLSSFRCVSAFIAQQVVTYAGPYPYIDGLLLQVTQSIDSIEVSHEARHVGREWLHAAPADSVVAERLVEFFAASAAPGHVRRVCHGDCRSDRVRARAVVVVGGTAVPHTASAGSCRRC